VLGRGGVRKLARHSKMPSRAASSTALAGEYAQENIVVSNMP
jgi:hypothetical protein